SPRVLAAIDEAMRGDRLRKYPDPLGTAFRQTAARLLDVDPEGILIGNGSDDVLTILTRAFVPEGGLIVSLTPSYLLYRTLAELQGARFVTVPFIPDWSVPDPWPVGGAHLTFLTNPNSPSGTAVGPEVVGRLAERVGGPLVVAEAYADFAAADALGLARAGRGVVTRRPGELRVVPARRPAGAADLRGPEGAGHPGALHGVRGVRGRPAGERGDRRGGGPAAGGVAGDGVSGAR